jgi:hypothetical protein
MRFCEPSLPVVVTWFPQPGLAAVQPVGAHSTPANTTGEYTRVLLDEQSLAAFGVSPTQ